MKEKKDFRCKAAGLVIALLALSIKLQNDTGDFWGHIDGWGIHMLVTALGLAAVFFIAHKYGDDDRKSPVLSAACCFLAVCTVLGKCYLETGSWDILICNKLQICKTCLIGGGIS